MKPIIFMFTCDLYATYRLELETSIGVRLNDLPNNAERFKCVFDHPYSLGRFIDKAFQKRRDKLYKG